MGRILLIISILFLTSCGSDLATSNLAQEVTPPSSSDGTIELSNHPTIEPSDYTGKVVIKFKDGTHVRLRPEESDGPFVGKASRVSLREASATKQSPELNAINNLVKGIASSASGGLAMTTRITSISRVTEMSEDEVDKWRAHWAKQSVRMHDWNLYYYLDVPNEEDARALVGELNPPNPPLKKGGEGGFDGVIEYAGILPKFYLTSVTTADISNEQGYLKSANAGGLGVEDGWALLDSLFPDVQLRGQGVEIVDQEYDWNFDHEILPIDETSEYLVAPDMKWWNSLKEWDGKGVPTNINHGTAVVGIIAGQGGEIGKAIKGIVPKAGARVGWIGTGWRDGTWFNVW